MCVTDYCLFLRFLAFLSCCECITDFLSTEHYFCIAATSKIVSPTQKYLKTSFHPKEITVYLDKIDYYMEKRARLLREVYGEQEAF